jgi:hypothetical protein
MMIAVHGPDTCAASVPEVRDNMLPHLRQLTAIAQKQGATLQGAWADMPAHTLYFLVDAPNAHVVNQVAMDAHLMDWNTVTVQPVITFDQAMGSAEQRQL